jgi:hypothetical protein
MKRSLLIAVGLVLCGLAVVALTPRHPVAAQGGPPQSPPGSRWQIFHAEMSLTAEKPHDAARNTILLDTATGESWVLWTGEDKDHPYQWVQVKRDGR